MKFKALFPDRMTKLNDGELNLYASRLKTSVELPTEEFVWAENKREAWEKMKGKYAYERIVIEPVNE